MKPNPCYKCLVKPCCSEVCQSKNEYTDELLNFLGRLGMNIYDKNGKKFKRVSKHTMKVYNEVVELCIQNNEQHHEILDRYVRMVVP